MRFDPRVLAPKSLRPYMSSQEAGEAFLEPAAAMLSLSFVLGMVMPWAGEWWWWATNFVMGAVVGHVGSARIMRRVRARMVQERIATTYRRPQ